MVGIFSLLLVETLNIPMHSTHPPTHPCGQTDTHTHTHTQTDIPMTSDETRSAVGFSCTAILDTQTHLVIGPLNITKCLNEDFSPFPLFPSLRFVNTTGSTHTSQMWICSFAVSLNYSSWAKAMQLPAYFYHGHVCDRTIWTSDSHCSNCRSTSGKQEFDLNGFSLSTVQLCYLS